MLVYPPGQGRKHLLSRRRAEQHVEVTPILEQGVLDITAGRCPGGILDPSGSADTGLVHIAAGKGDDKKQEGNEE